MIVKHFKTIETYKKARKYNYMTFFENEVKGILDLWLLLN